MSLQKFRSLFRFDQSKRLYVGVERECFLQNDNEEIAPIAARVVRGITGSLQGNDRIGYELSACQLEDRTAPAKIEDLRSELLFNESILRKAEKEIGFTRLFYEVGPENMPLDVYPDPGGRYQEIKRKLPRHILRAGCRVIGTHVHVGMGNHGEALKAYNYAINYLDDLCRLGNNSQGERLRLYSVMADEKPPFYRNWQEFYKKAEERGFARNPRDCWHLIRISCHGSIEFRVFGATADIEKVCFFARICLAICQEALS